MPNAKKGESYLSDEKEHKRRVFKNGLNSFLNNNLQYLSIFLLLVIFYFSFVFILEPKYESILSLSSEVLREREDEFTKEYRDLISYQKNIEMFNEINDSDVDRILKMIPDEYLRDELFSEIVFFLIVNNFKLSGIEIYSPDRDVLVPGNVSRRGSSDQEEVVNPRAVEASRGLPSNVGVYYMEIDFLEIGYFDLRYLLNILENNLRLIDVTYLDFDAISGGLRLEAKTYYYKN